MKKFLIPAFALVLAGATFVSPASARRDVMIMLQQMPMTGTPPTSAYAVQVEVQMNADSMAAMRDHLVNGSMTLVCMPSGPTIMMCHGK